MLSALETYFKPDQIYQTGFFQVLDEVNATASNALVYCQNIHFLRQALSNKKISAVICKPGLTSTIDQTPLDQEIGVITSDDPRQTFFELYNQLLDHGELYDLEMDSGVGEGCQIHPSAVVSDKAKLGNNVIIGANAVIEANSIIHDEVYVAPNVVIGAEGLLTLREPDGGLMTVTHAGGVEIHQGCQILAGAVIAKSLFRQYTTIGKHSQIGIMTNIGHGAVIGNECVISGNTVVAGRARLENKVWVGTSSSIAQGVEIGEGAQVKMGSVVVANISKNKVVSGNFAVDHKLTMRSYLRAN